MAKTTFKPEPGDCFFRAEQGVCIYRRVEGVHAGHVFYTELRIDGVGDRDNIDDTFSVAAERAVEKRAQWHKDFVLYPRDDFAAALWRVQDFVRAID